MSPPAPYLSAGPPSPPPGAPDWMRRVCGRPGTHWSRRVAPPEQGGRSSAVLMLFGPGGTDGPDAQGGQDVVLTQRSDGLRSHAGQVAFPGGSTDPQDTDAVATALREAAEEVGLRPADVRVVGTLDPLFLSVTGFVVTPVLAWAPTPGRLWAVDPGEVAAVVRVPLAELVDPANRFVVHHPSGHVGPGFEASGLFVWGFTAGLLSNLLDVAGLAVPWDSNRLRALPSRVGGPDRRVAGADQASQTQPVFEAGAAGTPARIWS